MQPRDLLHLRLPLDQCFLERDLLHLRLPLDQCCLEIFTGTADSTCLHTAIMQRCRACVINMQVCRACHRYGAYEKDQPQA
jgi:hypothetical protein